MLDRRASVRLVTGFDDLGSGGLFTFDGSEPAAVDRLGSTGLAVTDSSVGRLLRTSVEFDAVAELLVYYERAIAEHRRWTRPRTARPDRTRRWVMADRLEHRQRDDTLRSRRRAPVRLAAFDRSGCMAPQLRQVRLRATVGDGIRSVRHDEGAIGRCGTRGRSCLQPDYRRGVRWDSCRAGWDPIIELREYPRGLGAVDDLLSVGESANRRDRVTMLGPPSSRVSRSWIEP